MLSKNPNSTSVISTGVPSNRSGELIVGQRFDVQGLARRQLIVSEPPALLHASEVQIHVHLRHGRSRSQS